MSRLRLLRGLLTLALWLAATAVALAAAGDLDPTFGVGGKALVGLGAPAGANAVALQPDGRILVGGAEQGIGTTLTVFVARILLPQGTLDPSYGGGAGWSRIDFGGFDSVGGVALQSDGRIVAVVADFSAAGTQSFVVRLLNPAAAPTRPSARARAPRSSTRPCSPRVPLETRGAGRRPDHGRGSGRVRGPASPSPVRRCRRAPAEHGTARSGIRRRRRVVAGELPDGRRVAALKTRPAPLRSSPTGASSSPG